MRNSNEELILSETITRLRDMAHRSDLLVSQNIQNELAKEINDKLI